MSANDTAGRETPLWKDAAITIAILLLAGLFILKSLPLLSVKSSSADPGAGFWPLAALGSISLFGIFNLASLYFKWKDGRTTTSRGDEDESTEAAVGFGISNRMQFVTVIGLLLIYTGILEFVGFFVATPFFLISLGWTIGYRRPKRLVVFGVGVSTVLQTTFGSIFNIVLPRGVGIFREISLLVQGLL